MPERLIRLNRHPYVGKAAAKVPVFGMVNIALFLQQVALQHRCQFPLGVTGGRAGVVDPVCQSLSLLQLVRQVLIRLDPGPAGER